MYYKKHVPSTTRCTENVSIKSHSPTKKNFKFKTMTENKLSYSMACEEATNLSIKNWGRYYHVHRDNEYYKVDQYWSENSVAVYIKGYRE